MKLRVSAVRTLLALGARDDIDRGDNILRLTAREICKRNMIEEQYVRDGLDGTFDGFDEKYLRMMWMMKKYGDDVDEGTDPRTRLERCEDEYKAEDNKYLYVRCVEEPLARVGSVPSEQETGIPQCAHEQSTVCLQARSEE